MKKRIISFIIVCLLSLSCLTVISSADAQLSNANDVITPELREVMNASKAADKIPVSIWTDEIDAAEVEELALKKTGHNKESIRALVEQGKGDTVTLDDVNEYIAVERKLYTEKQQSANQKFAGKYKFLNEAKSQEDAYVCSYAPMIVVSLTKSQIETLAKDSTVNTMYYIPKAEIQGAMNISLPLTKASYTRDTFGRTGNGINIGMVEPGVPNANAVSFSGASLEIHTNNYTISSGDILHATAVAEIMISNDTEHLGIVPDASLYSAAIGSSTDDSSRLYSAIEWLISKNVHVVNMSASLHDVNSGCYTNIERWIDHIAHNHSVHFVVAAGNRHLAMDLLLSHPALAYNAIAVGNIDDKNTARIPDDELSQSSCYVEATNSTGLLAPNKPDLVAPGENISTSSFPNAVASGHAVSGTSFAAPHVTGVVAQLIEQYPSLAVLQDLMKAMLTAAVSHADLSYTPYQMTQFEKYGAGLIDARACSEISYRGTFVSSSFTSAQSNYTKTYTFTATDSDNKIRVSLAWLKSVWFSGTDHLTSTTPGTVAPLANLDLIIISPNGLELPMCQHENYDLNTNLVVIEFDPETYGYGTYTVKVKIHDSTGTPTYFGLAWWADRN